MNDGEKRDDYVIVRLTCELGMNNLILQEYYRRVDEAVKEGRPLPDLPPLIPSQEDAVVATETTIMKIPIVPREKGSGLRS
jgi:hypothetical protein